ncbi:MAG: hypothetical protein PCFJNLEI_00491 [Verrucomicrobiae bacterium]|nr:hypothetical protein [Verrucomicrobiae bacterium]
MLKIKCLLAGVVGLLVSNLAVVAQTNLPAGGLGSFFSLDQFGPIGTAAEAESTYRKAADAILAAGGGVILIPPQAPPAWRPKNNIQQSLRVPPAPEQTTGRWYTGPQVTVIDGRGPTLKFLTPQIKGMEFERVLDLPPGDSLLHWDYHPILTIKNTTLRGSGSYHDWLQEAVPAGKDRRFYVATIRGIFPGMFLNALAWGGPVPRLCIKSLGFDKEKKMWYFVADTNVDVQKGAIMSNKHHTNLLSLESSSHTENQTFDVRMWRYKYSQGDTYLFDARFKYMSDVHSTAGDENGVLYAAFIEPLLNIFRGQVEKWDPATSQLVYKGSDGATLGSGRPLINLNPAKWTTNGTVVIVQPASWTDYTSMIENPVYKGKSYPTTLVTNHVGLTVLRMGGLIRFSADAPITDEVIGQYFAVDSPSEYVPGGQFGGVNLRRWYLIDSVTKNADGTKDITIVRHWWGAKSAGAPMLYKKSNATRDGHEVPLRYVIAPGVNVYDVSMGVKDPRRTVKLSPFPFAGTKLDFAPNDPVEQAIGPDPFKPISFRTWMWDAVPGAFPAPVFDIGNNGQVMREYLMQVRGGSGSIVRDTTTKFDENPAWDKLISFDSTCNIGLRFGADTGDAAILFTQPNSRVQPIKWYYGETNQLPKVAALTVSRETGDFNFTGGLVTGAGLSGGDKPARNLRGLNVAVKAGETKFPVKFPVAEADDAYGVFIEQSWIGNRAIVKKEATGFTVEFEKPAPANAKIDWFIVR